MVRTPTHLFDLVDKVLTMSQWEVYVLLFEDGGMGCIHQESALSGLRKNRAAPGSWKNRSRR